MSRLPKLMLTSLAPMLFFAVLLFSRASSPSQLVFDEIHYVPAAKELVTLTDDLNWVHPPGAKLIMGTGWLVLTQTLHVIGEPTVFRFVAILFGLWTLWAIRAWMTALGFTPAATTIAMWLTGFNFLWFVQSKTAMLDIFYIAFALWGLLDVWRAKSRISFLRGWIFLGLAFSCKWAAAPFIALALVAGGRSWKERIMGGAAAALVYLVTFIPLGFLAKNPVPLTELVAYHQRMLGGFGSINAAAHPYRSEWWEWITLHRPMWYLFESNSLGEHGVWAGGNPVLYWSAIPLLVVIAWIAIRRRDDRAARWLAALYWVPLLFWIVIPRKLQLYYYYLAPSLIVGPIVVWAHERFYHGKLGQAAREQVRGARGWLLLGFTLLCAATFIYFLPIMDARLLPPGRYLRYMWFRSWI